jgi:formylmethanofuran dehydrogenase subunit C
VTLRLRYRSPSLAPVEVEGVTPEALAGRTLAQIERCEIFHGNCKLPLAELFEVSGDASDGVVEWEGDLAGVHWIGAGMTGGAVRVLGNAGRHAGSGMRKGVLEIAGDAGDWAGAEMRGGVLRVGGSAGDNLGAAYRGSGKGMTGGSILVAKNAGDEIGASLRRGLIAVGGRAGDLAGFNMFAGTIVVAGQCGQRPCAGMRRGTLVLLSARPHLFPTFHYACRFRPEAVRVLEVRLRRENFAAADGLASGEFDLFHGDFLAGGRGEILVRA